jgi:hypothetical protein
MNEEGYYVVDPLRPLAGSLAILLPAGQLKRYEEILARKAFARYTVRAPNPIDRFLGFFKILEDLYGPTKKKGNLAKALKASDELFRIAQKQIHIQENTRTTLRPEDFVRLVNKFVKTRHECAHLRSKKGFGITHGDPRVRKEVEPLANMVREVAYEAIKLRS